jgi:hypothetical protein
MHSLWSFLARPQNRQILAWVGSGLVAVAAGAFAVMTYLWPAHETAKTVCAQQGVAMGGNVSGSTITNSVSGSTIAVPCTETKK